MLDLKFNLSLKKLLFFFLVNSESSGFKVQKLSLLLCLVNPELTALKDNISLLFLSKEVCPFSIFFSLNYSPFPFSSSFFFSSSSFLSLIDFKNAGGSAPG